MAFARGEDSRLASFDDTYCQVERTPGYGGRVFPFGSGVPRRRGGAPACTAPARNCTAGRAGIHRVYASRAFFVQQVMEETRREV
jgi:hypothetical protein